VSACSRCRWLKSCPLLFRTGYCVPFGNARRQAKRQAPARVVHHVQRVGRPAVGHVACLAAIQEVVDQDVYDAQILETVGVLKVKVKVWFAPVPLAGFTPPPVPATRCKRFLYRFSWSCLSLMEATRNGEMTHALMYSRRARGLPPRVRRGATGRQVHHLVA